MARAAGEPGANGTFSRFRGRLNRTVRPVSSSMLARVTLSGRVPTRSGPASPAEQQHVVPPVLRGGCSLAGEHRADQVRRPPRPAVPQRSAGSRSTARGRRSTRPASAAPARGRVCGRPSSHASTRTTGDQHRPAKQASAISDSTDGRGEQSERPGSATQARAAPARLLRPGTPSHTRTHQPPDPGGRPVARGELGRTWHDDGQQQQGDRPPHSQAVGWPRTTTPAPRCSPGRPWLPLTAGCWLRHERQYHVGEGPNR